MMRWIIVLQSLIVGPILVLHTPIQAQTDDAHSPVSIARIRLALQQPPPLLQIPEPGDMPTFHLEVRERLFVLQPIDGNPFDPTFGLPSIGELMADGIEKIRSTVVNYKRSRAERRARKEVEDALAAFCAVRGCPAPNTSK